MKHLPTGRLHRHDDHTDLVYSRVLPVDREVAWSTLSGRDPLGDIEVTVLEESEPDRMTARLEDGTVVETSLAARDDGATDLQLVVHDVDAAALGERGPRGDYLLGVLGARVVGDPEPAWSDYFPAGRAYYDTLAASDDLITADDVPA